jgi:hypothetical protein
MKAIIRVENGPHLIDAIGKKRICWYGHVQRMRDERLTKITMNWVTMEKE